MTSLGHDVTARVAHGVGSAALDLSTTNASPSPAEEGAETDVALDGEDQRRGGLLRLLAASAPF
jgi:hypothetical protein